jgi:hypothetical protein
VSLKTHRVLLVSIELFGEYLSPWVYIKLVGLPNDGVSIQVDWILNILKAIAVSYARFLLQYTHQQWHTIVVYD